MSALDELIAAVEAGVGFPRGLRSRVFGHDGKAMLIKHAYLGSLDAAKALHDALLPGWEWWVHSLHYWDGDEGPTCILRTGIPFIDLRVASARADSPARAWLIAILRAYRETQP